MSGKRMTLGELFTREGVKVKAAYQARIAYEATPEGQVEIAEREARYRKEREADERFAEANPPDPYQNGADTAMRDEAREAPADLDDVDEEKWLAGYDSQAIDDD